MNEKFCIFTKTSLKFVAKVLINNLTDPIEQIPDKGNAQRTKSVRLKIEFHWIKTLGTQIPHGMNHKIMSKRDIYHISIQ